MFIQDKYSVGRFPNIHAYHNSFWEVANHGITPGLMVEIVKSTLIHVSGMGSHNECVEGKLKSDLD
jgi:hypothetical protein